MESPFAPTAPYLPSQPHDRFHASSLNGLDPPREASLVSSGFATEPALYRISPMHPLSAPQFHMPRFENAHYGYGNPYASAPLIPTTVPAPAPLYDSLSLLGFQNADLTYLEPQSFSSSQPPTSPPATVPTYQINNSLSPASSRFPYIRPMPTEGLGDNSSIALPHRPKIPIELAARTSSREAQPANVVGTQGRRGPLPSADGRPAAVAEETVTGAKSGNNPIKDANGKFACAHCVKVYLHAKHLKRHLLRHTGTRPYSCGLCRETFSRSDILKRHFQKCSVRRGNPTGQTHLTYSRATKKANAEAAGRAPRGRAAVVPTRTRSLPSSQSNNEIGELAPNNAQDSFDFNALQISTPAYPEGPQPLVKQESCSNDVRRPSTSGVGGQTTNVYVSAPSSYDLSGLNYSGQITPDSITTSGAATPYQYPHEFRANQFSSDTSFAPGVPVLAAQSMPSGFGAPIPHILGSSHDRGNDLDWSMYFPPPGLDHYSQPSYHPVEEGEMFYRTGDDSVTIKMEYDPHLMPKPIPRS